MTNSPTLPQQTTIGGNQPIIDHISGLPAFHCGGLVWRAWVTDGGHRYEWRSTEGRCQVCQREGLAGPYWAACGGITVGRHYRTARDAMAAAARAMRRQQEAA